MYFLLNKQCGNKTLSIDFIQSIMLTFENNLDKPGLFFTFQNSTLLEPQNSRASSYENLRNYSQRRIIHFQIVPSDVFILSPTNQERNSRSGV